MKASYPYNVRIGESQDVLAGTRAYENIHKNEYECDVIRAQQNNIVRYKKGEPGFYELLKTGQNVKWAYTIYRELYIAVACDLYTYFEPTHAFVAGGKPVFGAGIATYKPGKTTEYGVLVVDNATGHYRVGGKHIQKIAELAWRDPQYAVVMHDLLHRENHGDENDTEYKNRK